MPDACLTGIRPLRSLNHVLDVLEALHHHPAGMGVTDVAKTVGISKGPAHAILMNLENRGYVRRTEGKHYQLGIKVWELGFSAQRELGLRDAASDQLHKLTQLTGESTHLSVYDGGEVLYLDKVSTPHAVQAYSRVGGRAPAYCVATGKALLAYQNESEIARVSTSLQPYTPRTIVDPSVLHAELRQIREQGYAVNAGEWRADVAGVAAPIRGLSGHVLAAIGISGPTYRLTATEIGAAIPHVAIAARAVTSALNARPDAAGPGRDVA